jgi:hypothetical protein
MSVTEAPAAAFSRWHESEINRPRDDVGAKATLAGASDCLPHQDCGGGGAAPSPKFQRSPPPAIGAESRGHSYKPNGRRRATTKLRPRADRRRRQKPNAPSCGPVCPTLYSTAASPCVAFFASIGGRRAVTAPSRYPIRNLKQFRGIAACGPLLARNALSQVAV